MKIPACLALMLCVSMSGTAAAEDSGPMMRAKHLANTLCVTCHGTDGVSVVDNYPSLAGQKAAYLYKQMIAFRDGNRKDPIMPNMVAAFDNEVIKALADYYSEKKQP